MFECRSCGHDHLWYIPTMEALRCRKSTYGHFDYGRGCLCSAADYVPLDNLEFLEYKVKEKENGNTNCH